MIYYDREDFDYKSKYTVMYGDVTHVKVIEQRIIVSEEYASAWVEIGVKVGCCYYINDVVLGVADVLYEHCARIEENYNYYDVAVILLTEPDLYRVVFTDYDDTFTHEFDTLKELTYFLENYEAIMD